MIEKEDVDLNPGIEIPVEGEAEVSLVESEIVAIAAVEEVDVDSVQAEDQGTDEEEEAGKVEDGRVYILAKKYEKGLAVMCQDDGYKCPRCEGDRFSDIKDYDVVPQNFRDRGDVFFIRKCLTCKENVVNFRRLRDYEEKNDVTNEEDGSVS